MDAEAERPLLLAEDVVFTCQQSGACCRSDWLIGVDDVSHARLRDVAWARVSPDLAGAAFVPLPFPLPGGERVTFARRSDGACVFLTPDARCGIHRVMGATAKPQVCREFPYHFVRTPDRVTVAIDRPCTARRVGETLAMSSLFDPALGFFRLAAALLEQLVEHRRHGITTAIGDRDDIVVDHRRFV